MSVRRDAASVGAMNGGGLMKSGFFWVAMLTASFLLGFLVIAPLAQLAKSRGDSSPNPAAQQTTGPQAPSPAPSHSAAPPIRKRNLEPDEPVDISPERSQESMSIQSAEEPTRTGTTADQPHRSDADRNATDTQPARTSDTSDQRAARDSGDSAAAAADQRDRRRDDPAPERRGRRTRRDRNESAGDADRDAQTGAAVDDARRASDTAETRSQRRSRNTRVSTEAAPHQSHATSNDGDVQKSEGIDR